MATVADSIFIKLGLDAKGLGKGINDAVSTVNKGAQSLQAGASQVSAKAFSQVASIAKMVAAPMMGAMSLGAVIKSYFGGVAQVAQMTGAYSTKMEEWAKKRALLNRYNREDIELYRKGRLGLLRFQITMGDLSAKIMRSLNPALSKMIDWLNSFSKWIDRNQNNIVRFLKICAAVIGTALIPAVVKLSAALLLNPIGLIIGLLGALILVLDDFVVWLQGGESALDSFWEMFGTREEVLEKLQNALKVTKQFFSDLWESIKTGAKEVAAWLSQVWESNNGSEKFINAFKTAWDSCKQIWQDFVAVFQVAWGLWADLLKNTSFLDNLVQTFNFVLDGARAFCQGFIDLFKVAFAFLKGLFTGDWSGFGKALKDLLKDCAQFTVDVIGFFVGLVAMLGNVIEGWLNFLSERFAWVGDAIKEAWNSAGEWLKNTWQSICDYCSNLWSVFCADLQNLWDEAIKWIVGLFETLYDGLDTAVTLIINAFNSAVNKVKSAFETIKTTVKGAIDNILGYFDKAIAAIKGFIDKVKEFFNFDNMVKSVKQAINKVLSFLPDSVKSFIGFDAEDKEQEQSKTPDIDTSKLGEPSEFMEWFKDVGNKMVNAFSGNAQTARVAQTSSQVNNTKKTTITADSHNTTNLTINQVTPDQTGRLLADYAKADSMAQSYAFAAETGVK